MSLTTAQDAATSPTAREVRVPVRGRAAGLRPRRDDPRLGLLLLRAEGAGRGPSADALSFYTALYDTTALSGLTAGDYQTLLADPSASFNINAAAPVQREQDPGAPRRRLATTTTPHLRGRVHGNERSTRTTDCRWQFTRRPALNWINIDITKLMSEQPDDGLEVYDTQSGDLLAAFTGRWDPAACRRSARPRRAGGSRPGGSRIATTRTRSASSRTWASKPRPAP